MKIGKTKTSPSPAFWRVPWLNFGSRLAATCREGDERYGERQWEGGLASRDYALHRASHILGHLYQAIDEFRQGITSSEDHLAHAMWGIQFLMKAQEIQEHGPKNQVKSGTKRRGVLLRGRKAVRSRRLEPRTNMRRKV